MDDSVQISCPRCRSRFRERARRLTNGFSRQCPACEMVVFFDDASPVVELRKAMLTAQKLRRSLAEEAHNTRSKRPAFKFGRGTEMAASDDD